MAYKPRVMAKGHIEFVVITPERRVLKESTDSLVFSAHDGEIGLLPGRAPLMCELGIGQLRYSAGGQTRRLFIDGGFAQVRDNQVSILTQQAVPAEAITPELISAAEQALQQVQGTDPAAVDAREKAQQRLRVLRELAG